MASQAQSCLGTLWGDRQAPPRRALAPEGIPWGIYARLADISPAGVLYTPMATGTHHPVNRVDQILQERNPVHGSFRDNANIAQDIKQIYRDSPNWKHLRPVHQEALEMIALKLSRILSGNPNELDHWLDIAGYAQLAVNWTGRIDVEAPNRAAEGGKTNGEGSSS